jgi:streptogramin lyase
MEPTDAQRNALRTYSVAYSESSVSSEMAGERLVITISHDGASPYTVTIAPDGTVWS